MCKNLLLENMEEAMGIWAAGLPHSNTHSHHPGIGRLSDTDCRQLWWGPDPFSTSDALVCAKTWSVVWAVVSRTISQRFFAQDKGNILSPHKPDTVPARLSTEVEPGVPVPYRLRA